MLVTRPVDHANLLIQFLIMRANDHGSTFNCPHRLNFSVQRELYELKISPNSIPYHFKSLDINKVTMGLLTSLLRDCAKEIAPIYPLILRNGTLTQLPQVVHVKRCKVLRVSGTKCIHERDYFLGGTKLERIAVKKDLRIWISHDLSWNHHVEIISSRAQKMLNLLHIAYVYD